MELPRRLLDALPDAALHRALREHVHAGDSLGHAEPRSAACERDGDVADGLDVLEALQTVVGCDRVVLSHRLLELESAHENVLH